VSENLALSYNRMDSEYCNLEQWDKAVSFFEKAINMWEKIADPSCFQAAESRGNLVEFMDQSDIDNSKLCGMLFNRKKHLLHYQHIQFKKVIRVRIESK